MQDKTLYNEQKRGSKAPEYSPAELKYRNDRLNELQMSYKIREQNHMELNDMTYSEYYLINRQQDMAYNPPKRNPTDSRIVSGIIHEKDQTILSILMEMNFQPKVKVFDHNDKLLQDESQVFTSKLKDSLIKEGFKDKLENILRVNISQGNVFVDNRRVDKFCAKKVPINKTTDPTKVKWKTILEKETTVCETFLLPNTSIFPSNILEVDIKKQPRMYYVMHYPTSMVAQIYKDFPRWQNVPKTPTQQVPVNVDGVWGDYWLQQPANDYVEVIIMESEIFNEYQVWLNGVQMYPIQVEDDVITGYPLTEISVSGEYTIAKGDYERIPFFFFSKSNPTKNQVKEEELNELMRLMFRMLRQKVAPPAGNNSNKVLQANIWDPAMITPDISKDDISILTPNTGIGGAEFSFYQLLTNSIAETSVSASVEGTNTSSGQTATQYVDQKKENLKKLGLVIDRTVELLRQIYWLRLYDEINYISEKRNIFDPMTEEISSQYQNFSSDETLDGKKGKVFVNLTDDTGTVSPYAEFKKEETSKEPFRTIHARPDYLQKTLKSLKEKIYIDVVAEPDGQNQSLLAILFNLLTQYSNLRGGNTQKINFDYLEKIIGENSGFESNKIFLDQEPVNPMAAMGAGQTANGGSAATVPMNPMNNQQNRILANAK